MEDKQIDTFAKTQLFSGLLWLGLMPMKKSPLQLPFSLSDTESVDSPD
jgi:hypothetical protein